MISENFFKSKTAIVTLFAACFVVLISLGVRQVFGLFFIDFNESLKISKIKILDKKHISNLFTSKSGFSIQGISFNSINESIGKYLLNYKKEINVIGYLNNNFWNNKKILQLVVRDIII